MNGLAWKIFALIVSIGLIIGGLTEEMVLIGTESSTALVVVGFVFLVGDIYALATHKKKKQEEQKAAAEHTEQSERMQASIVNDEAPALLPTVRAITVHSGFSFQQDQYKLSLNGQPCGEVAPRAKAVIQTERVKNALYVVGEKGEQKACIFFEVTGDEEPGHGISMTATDKKTIVIMCTKKSGLTTIQQ